MKKYLYNIIKRKSKILGYWQNKEDKKIYIDNIQIVEYTNKKIFEQAKKELFKNGELCIFYREGNRGYIEYPNGKIEVLGNKKEYTFKKSYSNIKEIKSIIEKYGGCTVYQNKGNIKIEVFKK